MRLLMVMTQCRIRGVGGQPPITRTPRRQLARERRIAVFVLVGMLPLKLATASSS
jgi:hypothetical protein